MLRPGRPQTECAFDGDEAESTIHFGVEIGGSLVGIASLYREAPPSASSGPAVAAWRLRGMATAPEVRGSGHGRALVGACLDHVAAHGGGLFWCNARTSAAGFYEGLGLRIEGPEFDLPTLGPHVRMVREQPAWANDSANEFDATC